MKDLYIYEANGCKFEGYEAWGEAWKNAVAEAKRVQCGIFRQIVSGEKIQNQFFAKGMFLDERVYAQDKLYIFTSESPF